MGGIPTNYHGEALNPTDGDPDARVPGLMAIGEAACVSVHGANRLGTNSLLDLVVFGRAAAHRAAEIVKPGTRQSRCRRRRGDAARRAARPVPQRRGASSRTGEIRLDMQRTMQTDCAVFRTGELLAEGVAQDRRRRPLMARLSVTDRSMIWNTDLVEALELDNLWPGGRHDAFRGEPQGEPRRPCAARIIPSATT